MIDPTLSANLAANSGDISALRRAARENSPEALKAAAKQFEALFMNMVLKSMRDATPQDGMFNSSQTKMYTSMLDQELSQHFAKRGIGLADAMLRQMTRTTADPQPGMLPSSKAQTSLSVDSTGSANASAHQQALSMLRAYETPDAAKSLTQNAPAADLTRASAYTGKTAAAQKPHVKAFQEKFAASAEEASRVTGIPAKFMLGQAALESGWGKREIAAADGTKSHNLFGIKASKGWKGKTVEVATTEYVNGRMERKMEKFRAYNSYDESFRDYAQLIGNNPRYKHVMANSLDAAGFAQGLQRAGYATDPNYAAKLTRIIRQSLLA